METEIIIELALRLKTILVYLILILFLIDDARADNYNKIARVIKILLYPLLLIFNIHYKKVMIIDEKNLDAVYGIGQILLKKGNHSEGIIKIRKAIGSIGFNPKESSITIY